MGIVESFIKEQKKNQGEKENNLIRNNINLKKEFDDYMFKVHLLGYIKKTIAFSSVEIKRRSKELRKREETSLNVLDGDFKEERINLLVANEGDFLEEIYTLREEEASYMELSHNKEIIKAINTLTPRQKQIVYRCIVMGERDTEVARKLGITKQGVNKTKLAALNKLRESLIKNTRRKI